MLVRQNIGWCHESRLHAISDDGVTAGSGHSGFSGADVALNQTVHGEAALHVLHGLFCSTLLGVRRGKGEQFPEILQKVLLNWETAFFADAVFHGEQAKLQNQQFFKSKPAAGDFHTFLIFWLMNIFQRIT